MQEGAELVHPVAALLVLPACAQLQVEPAGCLMGTVVGRNIWLVTLHTSAHRQVPERHAR